MERTICFLLVAGVACGLELSPANEITTYTTTESDVQHLEADLYEVGNLLFADGSAIKTTDGTTTSLIVGSALTLGYLNGIGGNARFNSILGFMQFSPEQILLVDYGNHCLRSADRTTNRSADYSGSCKEHGNLDGSGGLFDFPVSVLLDIKNPNRLIVAQNNALRFLNRVTKSLLTIWKGQASTIRDIIQEKSTGNIYFAGYNQIGYYSFESNTLTRIAGGSSWYHNVKFYDEHTLILTDTPSSKLEILDLDTNSSSYICSGAVGHETGSLATCSLYHPWSLLILNDTLFIGEVHQIRTIQMGVSQNSLVLPTSTAPSNRTTSALSADMLTLKAQDSTTKTTAKIAIISSTTVTSAVLCSFIIGVVIKKLRDKMTTESDQNRHTADEFQLQVTNTDADAATAIENPLYMERVY